MNISAVSLSFGQAAKRLMDDIVGNLQSNSSSQLSAAQTASGETDSTQDTSAGAAKRSADVMVDFSREATAIASYLQSVSRSMPSAGAPVVNPDSMASGTAIFTGRLYLTTQDDYNEILRDAYDATQTAGEVNTFTFSLAPGASNQPVITDPLANVLKGISTDGTVTPQAGETAAELNFAKTYAVEEAQGVTGRFYSSVDVDVFTNGMSTAEETSVMTAYNSGTLDIQDLNDAKGVAEVDSSGNPSTAEVYDSHIQGGQGEMLGGSGDIGTDYSGLQKTD